MLDHQKELLAASAHDKERFRATLINAFDWISTYEFFVLRKWIKDQFYHQHPDVISEVYQFLLQD